MQCIADTRCLDPFVAQKIFDHPSTPQDGSVTICAEWVEAASAKPNYDAVIASKEKECTDKGEEPAFSCTSGELQPDSVIGSNKEKCTLFMDCIEGGRTDAPAGGGGFEGGNGDEMDENGGGDEDESGE